MKVKAMIMGGMLVVAALGCRSRERTTTQTQQGSVAVERRAEESQKQSEQALDEAKKAQEQATEQQKEAAKAQQTVQEKAASLNEARMQVERERQEAQQAQQQAQDRTTEAQQRAQQAQQRALSAQEEAQRTARQETSKATDKAAVKTGQTLTAEGTVREVRTDQLVLERANEPALRLKVSEAVPVQSTDPAARADSLDDIPVGGSVRVRYRLEANQPVAERIELASAPSGAVR